MTPQSVRIALKKNFATEMLITAGTMTIIHRGFVSRMYFSDNKRNTGDRFFSSIFVQKKRCPAGHQNMRMIIPTIEYGLTPLSGHWKQYITDIRHYQLIKYRKGG